jgi:hypothetical protein
MKRRAIRLILSKRPSPDAGPDKAALGELPLTQLEVFLAHEIDGRGHGADAGTGYPRRARVAGA